MPPVTPSPHRFLSGRHRQHSPEKSRNARSTSQQTPHTSTDATTRGSLVTPNLSQFAPKPRFSFWKPPSTPSRPESPPEQSLVSALRFSNCPSENVEESGDLGSESENDDDGEMLQSTEQARALPTIEATQQSPDEQAWVNELPYSPKRRKLDSDPPTAGSHAHQTFKHPTTPASILNADPHRFTRASSVAGSMPEESATSRRPAFLRSSLAPPETREPLPEAFSPHRRGEKFVPGGMAATLQQWVVETGQSAARSRRGQGSLNGEDYVLHVRVDAVNGQRPLLTQGRRSDGTETRLCLMVDGKRDAISDVRAGSVIGVRAPTWDITLEQETWTVGVDWRVLRQQ